MPTLAIGDRITVQHGTPPRECVGVVRELHGPVCKVNIVLDDHGHTQTVAKMTKDLKRLKI